MVKYVIYYNFCVYKHGFYSYKNMLWLFEWKQLQRVFGFVCCCTYLFIFIFIFISTHIALLKTFLHSTLKWSFIIYLFIFLLYLKSNVLLKEIKTTQSCPLVELEDVRMGVNFQPSKKTSLIPKILGPFWQILGLKYVLIDMWANDQNEMMFFYFQP